MAITGHVYKITDRLGFFGAVATGGDPPHTSFGSMGRVQVELRTTFGPENFDVVISQQVMSNDHGLFILHRPSQLGSGLETTRNMQLVVRKQTSHSNVGPFHFRVFESIYRSRPFAWTAVNDTEQPISMFVDFGTTPDEDAITGKTVDEGITSAVSALTANHITDVEAYGFIWSDGVNMHLAGNLPSGGNRFISDFRIVLIGSESTNLHEFFTADLAGFHSQHICFLSDDALEEAIQRGINQSLGGLNTAIHDQLVAVIAAETKLSKAVVQQFVDSSVTTTFRRVRYPQVGTQVLQTPTGAMEGPVFGVAPDPCFGFPQTFV